MRKILLTKKYIRNLLGTPKILLVLFIAFAMSLNSCTVKNEQQEAPVIEVINPRYFNEEIEGYANDSTYLVNFFYENSTEQDRMFFDTTLAYYIIMNRLIPYNQYIELSMYRKVDAIYLGVKVSFDGRDPYGKTITDWKINTYVESKVSKEQYDYLNEKVAVARQLRTHILPARPLGWYIDGGTFMYMQDSGKFYNLHPEYLTDEGRAAVEEFWNDLYISPPFKDLMKVVNYKLNYKVR